MRVLKRDGWARQAWRNGRGFTNEIVRKDDNEGFVWRISVAELEESAMFSQFDGVDRVLTQLDGPPLMLTIEDTTVRTAPLGEPCAFAGEASVFCHINGGRARDLNVMTRRDSASATVSRVTEAHELTPPSGTLSLTFVARGEAQSPAGLLGADSLIEVAAGESARLALAPNSVAYRIDIRMR